GRELTGRMALGARTPTDAKSIRRFLEAPELMNAPDVAAFHGRAVKFFGEPLFADGWPFAAIPIGGERAEPIGVLYADIVSSPDEDIPPLDNRTQASLNILAELLDDAAVQAQDS
ncbi:MAG: hypothetical protein KDD44_11920, partial [Bdellovibrionales bacterium]|nr:hypothetical protein [Bdellovibrionales bacterium]